MSVGGGAPQLLLCIFRLAFYLYFFGPRCSRDAFDFVPHPDVIVLPGIANLLISPTDYTNITIGFDPK